VGPVHAPAPFAAILCAKRWPRPRRLAARPRRCLRSSRSSPICELLASSRWSEPDAHPGSIPGAVEWRWPPAASRFAIRPGRVSASPFRSARRMAARRASTPPAPRQSFDVPASGLSCFTFYEAPRARFAILARRLLRDIVMACAEPMREARMPVPPRSQTPPTDLGAGDSRNRSRCRFRSEL
jgi:hypothetical protein